MMRLSLEEELQQESNDAAVTNVAAVKTASDPSWRARVKHWTGLDRAIAFNVLARLWSAVAGVVTVLLIAHFLTPHEQGYYYTFFSLVALQIVFELGFCFVILQLAAHERARLVITPDGRIEGDAVAHSRLASVLRISIWWYSVAAVLMVATLLPAGSYFFSSHEHSEIALSWKGPWFLLVVAAALNLLMSLMSAFIEGCGFVALVAKTYLAQVVLGTLLSWGALATGHGLYAPAMLILGFATMQGTFLVIPKPKWRMLSSLMKYPVGMHSIRWRHEVWPFQWRIAITWLSSYFLSQLITPVLFSYQGAVIAGRMGMSLSISTSIGTMGLAWMSTKAAPFGSMVARGESRALNKLFFRTLWQSTVLVTAGAAAFFLCLLVIRQHFPKVAARVLPPWAFLLLLLTMIMNHVLFGEALYMRAHKREPLLIQATVVATLLGISTVTLARFYDAAAVTISYFVFGGLLSIVWGTCVFVTKRREWYGRAGDEGGHKCQELLRPCSRLTAQFNDAEN